MPALIQALDAGDLWLRVQAAEALAAIGKPALAAVPKLLEMLAQDSTREDPRNMQQRYLAFAVFGEMLKNSLDEVDPELLRQAVVAGLQNQDARARGAIGGIYQQLTYEEIEPLLPAIREAIVTPCAERRNVWKRDPRRRPRPARQTPDQGGPPALLRCHGD